MLGCVVAVNRDKQIAEVLTLMEGGMPEEPACEKVGIARNTFRSAALKVVSAEAYARACEGLAQAQVMALEQTIKDMRDGKIDAQMARVEIDARKWFASKFLPKRYGDKLELEATIQGDVRVTIGGDA